MEVSVRMYCLSLFKIYQLMKEMAAGTKVLRAKMVVFLYILRTVKEEKTRL